MSSSPDVEAEHHDVGECSQAIKWTRSHAGTTLDDPRHLLRMAREQPAAAIERIDSLLIGRAELGSRLYLRPIYSLHLRAISVIANATLRRTCHDAADIALLLSGLQVLRDQHEGPASLFESIRSALRHVLVRLVGLGHNEYELTDQLQDSDLYRHPSPSSLGARHPLPRPSNFLSATLHNQQAALPAPQERDDSGMPDTPSSSNLQIAQSDPRS